MFKLVRKSIKELEFKGNRAILKAKGSGMGLFWLQIVLGGLILPGGIVLGVSSDEILFLFIFSGLGAALLISAFVSPIYEWFEIDLAEGRFKYFSGTVRTKNDPLKAKEKTFSFSKLTIDWESVRQFGSVTILIKARDGSQFFLSMPGAEHAALIEWLSKNRSDPVIGASSDQTESETSSQAAEMIPPPVDLYKQKDAMGHAAMLQEIKTWGRSLLFLGVVHLIASGLLNPGWGITLLAIGGLSFLFKEASMFVMYAVTLIWVGISNSLSLDIGIWTLFGLYQIYLGVRLFQKYRRFRDYEREHLGSLAQAPPEIKAGRASKLFSWIGAALTGVGLIVYVGVWVFVFIAVILTLDGPDAALSDSLLSILDLITGVALGLGIIGFGLSLSSVVSKYKPRIIGWIGVVLGGLLVLAEVGLNIWIIITN